MCGPFAIPLALVAAGSVAKYFGGKQAESASTNTYNAERQRQEALTGQQTARFQDSLDRTKEMTSEQGQAAAAGARENTLAAAIAPTPTNTSYLPGSTSAPSIVATAQGKAAEGSAATSANLAHTLAALGGTTDQLQKTNIGIGRNSQSIGQLGSFKAGSAGVLDAELKAAAQKGAFLRNVGGLAQTIGKAWMMGGVGGGASAASTSGTIGSDIGLSGTSAFSQVSPGII